MAAPLIALISGLDIGYRTGPDVAEDSGRRAGRARLGQGL